MSRRRQPRSPVRLPPRAAYQRWAENYAESGRNPLSNAAEAEVDRLRPAVAGRQVLDVACGDGRYARQARSAGAQAVVAVDFAPAMLSAARRTTPALDLAAADMCALPFAAATFDLVFHVLALGHVANAAAAIREVGRILAPGGQLVLVDLHPAAKARGWRRTFRDRDGHLCEVSWHAHSIAVLRSSLVLAGLRLTALHEVPLRESSATNCRDAAATPAHPSPRPDALALVGIAAHRDA